MNVKSVQAPLKTSKVFHHVLPEASTPENKRMHDESKFHQKASAEIQNVNLLVVRQKC